MKHYQSLHEDSIQSVVQDVVQLFVSMMEKGMAFSKAIDVIADKFDLADNDVLNILETSSEAYYETTKAMKTMVTRMNTAKLKSRKGKDPATIKKAEDLWRKATEIAKAKGQEGNYAYIMGIWKKMTGYRKPRGK